MTGPAFRSTSSPTDSVMSLSSLEQTMSRTSPGLVSPSQKIRSRTQSISSDRPSTIGHGLMSPPLSVSPEAGFIAASAASQIVTNDHDSHAEAWYDQLGIEPSGETALVSPAALQLVNNFLDQLLFNFLSTSRSTTLSALRPAVTEVLKPKLAKDAINQADEELREYLGGSSDDEDGATQEGQFARDWDLELVWKRTRLRCMVYSSLGDMEEEDEDFYTEQEDLDSGLGDGQGGAVPAAVSIFLTSILEFMGEAALVIAGQAAYHRIRDKYEKKVKKGDRSPSDLVERIVVEDVDMERVALDRTLGRLWRAWKKKLRLPPPLPDNGSTKPYNRDHMRQASLTFNEAALPPTVQEPETEAEVQKAPVQEPIEDYLVAAKIPLPMRDNDIDEIEVPGLCLFSGDDDDEDIKSLGRIRSIQARPKSLMIFSFTVPNGLPTPTSQPPTPVALSRKRSNSLPTPVVSPLLPFKRQKVEATVDDQATETPEEAGDHHTGSQEAPTDGKTLLVDAQQVNCGTTQLSPLGGQLATVSESPEEERTHKRNVSSASVVINTAAAVEVATVAGFKAQAEEEMDQDVTDIEEDDEEPQVFTSSRISMSGRSTSPTTSEPGNKPTAASLRPVRTLSVHSLRLIDVTGPRSPSIRSRGSSVDATELIRSGNLSRANSVSTTPIVEEYRTSMEPQPATKASTSILSNESISEAEEYPAAENKASRQSQDEDTSATPVATPRGPARFSQLESDVTSSQPIFGSARRKSPPAPNLRSSPAAPTKSANLAAPRNGGTFFFDNDDKPEVPEKVQYQSRVRTPGSVGTHLPTVPARSPGRDALAGQQRGLRIQTGPEAATIAQPQPQYQAQAHTRNNSAMSANRQQHTSASSVSSANFINNNNTPNNNRPNLKAAARSSEESVATSRADVERNFEELIQSDETIQYTLTPQSMRDDVRIPYSPPSPPFVTRKRQKLTTPPHAQPFNSTSPLVSVKSRKSEDVARTRERSRSTSVNRANNGIKRSPSGSRAAAPGLTSHHGPSAQGLHVNGSAAMLSAKGRPNGQQQQQQQARDARMPRESLADFADFIRSTGPTGESSATPIVNAHGSNAFTRAAGNGGHPVRQVALPIRTTSNGMPSQPPQAAKASIDSNRTDPNPNIPRKQARDAVIGQREDNSDLIDFIRRGPPNAVDSDNTHRIPRTVAPFRTTMDSDQMSGAVGGKAVDAQIRNMDEVRGSQASTTITDYSMPSVQSSVNSSTGLLRNKNAHLNEQVPSYGGAANNEDMPMPKRKTRRVRDPYAIDLSDEEEDDDDLLNDADATPKPSRRAQPQEESLADFLRNYAPPPEPVQAPVQATANRPKKKASSASLMARFTRRDSTANSAAPGGGFKTAPPPLPQSNRNLASRAASVSSAKTTASQRHIPIHVNMPPGVDKYAVPKTAPSSGLGSKPPISMMNNGGGGGGGRVQMKRFEPREPVSVPNRTATSDLADFLRNSGPPPGALVQEPYHQPAAQSESKNGFFGRRKKSSLA